MSSLDRFTTMERAFYLLRVGFRSPIVRQETGLPSSTLRDMARQLNGGQRASSGPLPSASYIVSNRLALLEASLLASTYRGFLGPECEISADIDDLVRAHKLYLELRMSLSERQDEPLCINRAWVIARNLRSDLAWLKTCSCGAKYLVVDKQKLPAGCPVCNYTS